MNQGPYRGGPFIRQRKKEKKKNKETHKTEENIDKETKRILQIRGNNPQSGLGPTGGGAEKKKESKTLLIHARRGLWAKEGSFLRPENFKTLEKKGVRI